ncbi:MAG TPA: hypothetical protein VGQ74_05135, partial [Methylomirabilota bacterium]|nr:hypothetical protein [Methylomirabilota bacterium]
MATKRPQQAVALHEGPAAVGIGEPGGGFEARFDIRGKVRVDGADPLPMRLPRLRLLEGTKGVEPGRQAVLAQPDLAGGREDPLDGLHLRAKRPHEAMVHEIERVGENAERLEAMRRSFSSQ